MTFVKDNHLYISSSFIFQAELVTVSNDSFFVKNVISVSEDSNGTSTWAVITAKSQKKKFFLLIKTINTGEILTS